MCFLQRCIYRSITWNGELYGVTSIPRIVCLGTRQIEKFWLLVPHLTRSRFILVTAGGDRLYPLGNAQYGAGYKGFGWVVDRTHTYIHTRADLIMICCIHCGACYCCSALAVSVFTDRYLISPSGCPALLYCFSYLVEKMVDRDGRFSLKVPISYMSSVRIITRIIPDFQHYLVDFLTQQLPIQVFTLSLFKLT